MSIVRLREALKIMEKCRICLEVDSHSSDCPGAQHYAWATVTGGIRIQAYKGDHFIEFSAAEVDFLFDQLSRAVPLSKRQYERFRAICDEYDADKAAREGRPRMTQQNPPIEA